MLLIYARVSTREQAGRGVCPRGRHRQAQRLVRAKNVGANGHSEGGRFYAQTGGKVGGRGLQYADGGKGLIFAGKGCNTFDY